MDQGSGMRNEGKLLHFEQDLFYLINSFLHEINNKKY
jgi:hypothetical protein